MEKKQKSIMNYSLLQRSTDEQDQNNNPHRQQLLSNSSVDYLMTSSSSRRCRSSIINESTEFFSNNEQLLYNQNPIPMITSKKRPAHDDSFIPEYGQHTHKRARHEQITNIGLENQPPSAKVQNRSSFLCHPRQDGNHLPAQNEIPSSFNQLFPSLSSYHRIHNASNHQYEQNLSHHFISPSAHTEHWTNQSVQTFTNHPSKIPTEKSTYDKTSRNIVKNNIHLVSPSLNLLSPLRTTNFVLDSKQQTMSVTIMRPGNISPAHSDTSTESTSTCSSDEQQFHPNLLSLHYHQPSRSNRERENYEQLLDLAEKLADPNRYNQVNIEQFTSYRYKSIATTAKTPVSKQTACVICMSQFKNGQHIRVLPCQHEYHSKCIARWFTMNSSCPICRRDNFLLTY